MESAPTNPEAALGQDRYWMARCLELARRGRTAPNPRVGCAIVKNGHLLGEGWHERAGQPHAEVRALDAVGDRSALVGATLYVNLEPCDHQGRTPPCTAAIIPAGIQRVVVGTLDSDPRVSGRGCDRLRAAGIDLTLGILEAECRAINEGFFYRLRHGQPLGLWKYAMTLDGKIATSTGHSQWITSPPARHYVHQLRGDCDAVITGGNTVRLDNPQLTCHGAHPTNPLRVILTRSFRLPHQAQVWQVGDAPTLVVTEVAALQGQDDRRALLEQQGVEVLALPQLTIASVVATLGQRGCNQVLWECGAPLAAAAMAARAVQKVYAFIAPKIIGGHGNGAIANLGITHMDQAIHLSRTSWQTVGDDWLLVGYVDPLS